MDKFFHSRFFHFLVCFVLVCCILVNASPIKAKATAVVAGLTVAEVLGYLTLIVGTTAGAVYMVNNREEVAAIGQSISIGDEPGDEDALNHVVKLTENINGMWDAGGDGSGFDPRLGTKIAQGLLALIGGTLVTAIASGFLVGKSESEDEASDGYWYYNGILLPTFPALVSPYDDDYIYQTILFDSVNNIYYCFNSTIPFLQKDNGKYSTLEAGSYMQGSISVGGTSWSYSRNIYSFSSSYVKFQDYIPIYANYDLCDYESNDVVILPASEPSKTYTSSITVPILPEIYVGDLPSQIENGDLDEDESKERILAPLPDYIDITKILKSTETAVEDLRQWQQQVIDGQKSLEQAIEDISASEESSEPDETGPEEDEGGEEEDDPEKFSLDLRKFFPFCIPYDIYEFWSIIVAPPQAPVFEWVIKDLEGNSYEVVVDLSCWDPLAAFFRDLELLLFIFGLMWATKHLIKW